ncbi:DUF5455 family protein [Vogesella sp. DC21W]|uniref:DUF5455 family protein n=1 Tax=Vogesella aquatica TaxID=2984206 RepID=A0ABT5J1E5_9NEIS|nr:DUF5455 family protein [Vogesella aquatica]MDC7718651.1 DUF5455 family protein [Vogesella aquatica]
MPFLAQFLISALSSLLGYFGSRLAKTVAMTLFTVGLISGFALVLYTLLKGLAAGLVYTITNEWVLMGMGILWPSNAEACITAILTAEMAVYVFRFKKNIYLASSKQ